MTEAIGGGLEVLGAALVALAGIGLFRLPDPLTRTNAVSKAAVLGVALLLMGVLLDEPEGRTAVLVPLVLVMHVITVPLSGLALGRAAYRAGTARPPLTRIDEPRDQWKVAADATRQEPG
jgi:multicomponent Na+:H+ antiporter subunit G